MTIGIDARFFGPKGKGLGRYTQKLIEALEQIDQENHYLIFLRKENWEFYQPSVPNFRKVLADYKWYSLKEQIFMPFLILRYKVDLMHFAHFNIPVFYPGKFVVTIHDLILRHFQTRRASTLGPIKYWIKNLGYRIVIWTAIKRAKKIITVSNYVKNDIIKLYGVDPKKIKTIYEGAIHPWEVTRAANKKKLAAGRFDSEKDAYSIDDLAKYGIHDQYLLYVGHAYPHKNLEKLIEAFAILNKGKNDLQLVLVGELDYFYQRLKDRIFEKHHNLADKIIFTDFVSDIELGSLYKNAALYVFPSFCEGFGLPPLEAMAFGAPVVCSCATCLPEILGQAAVYFNPEDPEDMASQIKGVLEDENLKKKLISDGLKRIEKYSWKKAGEETLGVYGQVKIDK